MEREYANRVDKQIPCCLSEVIRVPCSFAYFSANSPNKVYAKGLFSRDLDVGNIAKVKNKAMYSQSLHFNVREQIVNHMHIHFIVY